MTFDAGTRVRTKAQRSDGHTRLPAYLQRLPGVVERLLGEFPLPDARAVGPRDAHGRRLYTVRFAAADVWPHAPAGDAILADLFEDYLEPMP